MNYERLVACFHELFNEFLELVLENHGILLHAESFWCVLKATFDVDGIIDCLFEFFSV